MEVMEEMLGDLYFIHVVIADSLELGFVIRRTRQLLWMMMKAWLYPVLRESGLADLRHHSVWG